MKFTLLLLISYTYVMYFLRDLFFFCVFENKKIYVEDSDCVILSSLAEETDVTRHYL